MLPRSLDRVRMVVGALIGLVPAAGAVGGPDVNLNETSVSLMATSGQTRAYSISSFTCNVGNQDLLWTFDGTPGLAMNLYRLHNGRLEQIGQSWVKTACCAGAGPGCGLACNGHGGDVLGAGCLDVYDAGWNAIQESLGPRSRINAHTGQFGALVGGATAPIDRLLQVNQADLSATGFPTALYFVEGVYVADDEDIPAKHNNASHKRVTVNPTSFALTTTGAMQVGRGAIHAWRDHGLGPDTPDPSVTIAAVDVPGEGRFIVGSRVRPPGQAGGPYRYEYAVFNLSSDRAGGSLTVPTSGGGGGISGAGFRDVNYHSGEVYDSTDWSVAVTPAAVTWQSPQTFAQNPNSNALRWGTMYNFWFDSLRAPRPGVATLGLFKPGTPASVGIALPVPGCRADVDADGHVLVADIFAYLSLWFGEAVGADWDGSGAVELPDLFMFLGAWFGGCD